MRRAILALVALLALSGPTATSAAECPKTSLAEIEAQVMCPVCGTPLALATEAPQANRERALIQRLIDRCQSEEQIKAVLVSEYGEDVLALPEAKGFNASAYLVPALIVLVAAFSVALAARRWRRGGDSGATTTAGPPPDAASARRLEDDLERYEL